MTERAVLEPKMAWNATVHGTFFPGGVQPRIVGGQPVVPPDKYPWMVLLGCQTQYSILSFCGGTIVSQDYVLSAAHCDPRIPDVCGDGLPFVILTPYVRGDPIVNYRWVDRVYAHPLYEDDAFGFDALLLHLTVPITDKQPVALPQRGALLPTGTPVLTMGWGTVDFQGDFSSTLQQVQLYTVDDTTCARLYRNSFDPEQMLCAFDEGKDSCQGDSGGPLVEASTLQQFGIVSFGIGCGDDPGVYTEVSSPAVYDWIRMIIGVGESPLSSGPSPPGNGPSLVSNGVFTCHGGGTIGTNLISLILLLCTRRVIG